MTTKQHAQASKDAQSGRGIHGIYGATDVADETARAAIVVTAADVATGRVWRQTGGDRPGIYVAIAEGSGLDKFASIDNPALKLSASVEAADFDAVPGVLHRWDQSQTLTATLPVTPPDDTRIGFVSVTGFGGSLTLDAGASTFFGLVPTIPVPTYPSAPVAFVTFIRYSADDGFWTVEQDTGYVLLASTPNSLLRSNSTGNVDLLTVDAQRLVGRRTGGELFQQSGPEAATIIDAIQALTTGASIGYDLSVALNAEVTLDQVGHSLDFSNALPGQRGRIKVSQDGTGARTISTYTVDTGTVRFPGGIAPVLSVAANAVDYLIWHIDSGGDLYIQTFGLDWS